MLCWVEMDGVKRYIIVCSRVAEDQASRENNYPPNGEITVIEQSESMQAEQSKEAAILKAVKRVLTEVIKDTATKPGMIHPLTENTMNGMRDCLVLISQREHELTAAKGGRQDERPRFIDEPPKEVVVAFDSILRARPQD